MKFPWFRRRRRDEELEAEIRSHLEMAAHDRMERGETAEQARENARREFGNVGLVKEATREMWSRASLEGLWQDLRFGVRMLRKQPGFTLIAVLLLALGIGANTAIFSIVDAVLLRSLPVSAPERLVLLSHTGGAQGDSFSHDGYEHLRDHDRTLSGMLAYYPLRLTVSVDGQPEPTTTGQLVTGSYYAVLGVNAALGRTIAPEDDRAPGAHPVCVISDGYWRRRFGRDPGVVGKT
ncbi:MAG: permease prefix domain 1-containing protein, partial [Blastocatellia bacterium]